MRKRLFDNISDLNKNKYRLMTDEYQQLLNYHHYALSILDNRKAMKVAEASDPYYQNLRHLESKGPITNIDTVNPYEDKLKVIYTRDGRAKVIDTRKGENRFKAEWEKQFDENVINPPCYAVPPSNVWGLPQKLSDNSQGVRHA